MEHGKCPVCGASLDYFLQEIGTNPYYSTTAKLFGCPTCRVGFNSRNEWIEYVSKFPPIMRVEVGDKLIYYDALYERQGGIVQHIDRFSMKILMKSGDYPTSDRIIKWPWEIEQDTEN